jgi:hypothetical protein
LCLVVPAECEKLTWPEPEHKEHANNQTVAVAKIEKNNGNLLRRKVDACNPLSGAWYCQLRGGVLDYEFKFDSFIEDRAQVDSNFGEDTLGKIRGQFIEVCLEGEFVKVGKHYVAAEIA